ncbi:hypothetical protein QVD17_14273 [Tagetes erecta]|uniref:Reverse transcriptase zinc-binding domain-containing protein n=1 Tax=Tagetes erecta TaxID=13708 RepID=A0AAD8KWU6_TARER|nr:hypothetical protein QVD17_14273 [Tagetes erecta]
MENIRLENQVTAETDIGTEHHALVFKQFDNNKGCGSGPNNEKCGPDVGHGEMEGGPISVEDGIMGQSSNNNLNKSNPVNSKKYKRNNKTLSTSLSSSRYSQGNKTYPISLKLKDKLWSDKSKSQHGTASSKGGTSYKTRMGSTIEGETTSQGHSAAGEEGASTPSRSDVWKWDCGDDTDFSVKSVRRLLELNRSPVDLNPMNWSCWVPLKVKSFIWKVRLNRIPSKVALGVRGVQVGSEECSFCLRKKLVPHKMQTFHSWRYIIQV